MVMHRNGRVDQGGHGLREGEPEAPLVFSAASGGACDPNGLGLAPRILTRPIVSDINRPLPTKCEQFGPDPRNRQAPLWGPPSLPVGELWAQLKESQL